MTDLAEFLLARIAEDEQVARVAQDRNLPFWVAQEMGRSGGSLGPDYINRFSPARVLAECEAKRRIVDRLIRAADLAWSGSYAVRDDARASLADLVLPYADHPDYREEWRP